jgi:putative SOS response-associated peptidase YedK
MCGRAYRLYNGEELESRYGGNAINQVGLHLQPSYNLAPTQLTPVIFMDQGKETLDWMRWGLIPSWALSIKDAAKYSLLNARVEEIETKRSYASPFKLRRCIVPLSGFYEWKKTTNGEKRPFALHLKHEAILSVAGVWEEWSRPGEETVRSFSLLTTASNSFMQNIHDRMPVFLNLENESAWLDPSLQDPQAIKAILKPCPSDEMEAREVSKLVNSVKNQGPEVLGY